MSEGTTSSRPFVEIAIGVLKQGQRVCLSQRQDHQHLAGYWEFPGGKIESGESPEAALTREIHEELGIEAGGWQPLITVPWHYEAVSVRLRVFVSEQFDSTQIGEQGKEGQKVRWCEIDALSEVDFPQANRGIVQALQLPHQLMSIGGFEDLQQGLDRLETALQNGVRLAQLKAKGHDPAAFLEIATAFAASAHQAGGELLINGEPEWLQRIPQADGLILSSGTAKQYQQRPISQGKRLGISVHTAEQADHAVELQADFLLLSPVQATSAHPDLTPVGWEGLQTWCENLSVPVYALGGMKLEDESKALECGAQGIALSRGLWPA